MSQVTCHMSHVTCHVSHVTFHLSLTPTATDLPLLNPPLSTVDWFQRAESVKISLKKEKKNIVTNTPFIFKAIYCVAKCSQHDSLVSLLESPKQKL